MKEKYDKNNKYKIISILRRSEFGINSYFRMKKNNSSGSLANPARRTNNYFSIYSINTSGMWEK